MSHKCIVRCLAFLSTAWVTKACDSTGLQKCQSDYFAAVPGASGSQTCDNIETMRTCFNTKGADCEAAAMAQFNMMVDTAKKPMCEADGTCANHTLCTGAEGAPASGARGSSTWSLLLMVCCAIFSLVFVDACDVSGLQQCQSDYVTAAPDTSGTLACERLSTMRTCFNTKGAGCDVAALAQFNMMVDNAKKPMCEADGAAALAQFNMMVDNAK